MTDNLIISQNPRGKRGLALDEHREIGAELARIARQLSDIHIRLAAAYPAKAGFEASILQAEKHLARLRSDLENRMFAENPRIDNATGFAVYYPKQEAQR